MHSQPPKDVSPQQARFIAGLLKHRFPWLDGEGSRDISRAEVIMDLHDFHEILTGIGDKPELPESVTVEEGYDCSNETVEQLAVNCFHAGETLPPLALRSVAGGNRESGRDCHSLCSRRASDAVVRNLPRLSP